uniref:RNA-directed RNA polymerase L n=1 Tax=Plasmopara viticola lesion associated mycobunyavirales-like virus 3 TaxID=2689126 RepID=A0A6B9HC87_9VIRU|nr:RNA dependent RNA polymerase [Plasmopara viticola lesion associated mycobunyavirales-like virus 3]
MASTNAINHNANEQIRVITQVYEFLSVNDTIGMKEFKSLIKLLGQGMATRLRLTPDKNLKYRIEHLYAVVSCASGVTPLYENQIILSFEGMSTFYNFDCDLVIEVNGRILLIDFTSSKNAALIEDKNLVLQNKTMHPSLINKNVGILVKGFDHVGFKCPVNTVVADDLMDMPEAKSLKLIETICNIPSGQRKLFIDNCGEVYDYMIGKIADMECDIKAYNPPKSSQDKVKNAITSVSSNNMVDTVKFLSSSFKKTYEPFIESLKKITAQADGIKNPFVIPAADLVQGDNDLSIILNNLSDDYLAKVLKGALDMPKCVANVSRKGELSYTLNFELSRTNKRMLSPMSNHFISARHIKGHYFEIVFSYDAMDKFMRRVYCGEQFKEVLPPKGASVSIESVLSKINSEEAKLNDISQVLNKRLRQDSHSTIWDKMLSVSRLARSDLGNVGNVATNLINSTSFSLSRTLGGAMVSHYYEVVKTFAASIKNSHKKETYYVGVNGPYNSVTITKMSATQDSFDRAHYCTISKFTGSDNGSSICISNASLTNKITRTKFRTFDTNDLSYLLRLPYYVVSLLSWDIENGISNGKIITSDIPEKLTSSILHCLVNRDLFAQASQQVRYLYMSSIGYGSTPADIVKKFDFINPVTTWEFVYLVRMIKMGLALSVVRDNGAISEISVNGDLNVCFPHSSKVITHFSQVVSSMYYCNIFNKFRAFHEVSEAFCFNELDEEDKIYKKSLKKNPLYHAGVSQETFDNVFNVKYLLSHDFVKNERLFVDELVAAGVGRFRFSLPCVISASYKKNRAPNELITAMYESVNESPIEACTMRGSMDDKKPSDKSQGIRAASAIFEEIIKKYDETPEMLNNNAWLSNVFINNILEKGGDASLYSLTVDQLCNDTVEYFYRIVQKDQVGNREISVLNAVFRIGAMFVENLSKTLSAGIKDVDLLENPDKDYVFEKSIQNTVSKHSDKVICYDNSDQKRWGPNHLLNSFCAMFLGSINNEPGLVKLICHVASKVLKKKAKFPESLIHLFNNMNKNKTPKITREGLDESHGSATLKTFFSNHANDIFNNVYCSEFGWGMCQGIFHATSSVYHAIMCKVIEEIFYRKYGDKVIMKSFCTSDDSSRIIVIDSDLPQVQVIKELHSIIRRTGCIFNIIRNEAKSAFNFHIAEFNSTFFKKGVMATPTIKQRISKIDAGAGQNHVEDYMAALSSSANYFTIGGSYAGAITLSILNIVLHTEQWSRWKIVLQPDQYFKPVELGGFPVIEPFSTCLAGAVSNLYLRASNYVTDDEYARVFSTIITENPEEIRLSDYHRVPKSLSDDANAIKIFKNTGALGIYSLVRTDKKLSQFEKRHGLSKWALPDSFITLKKHSPDPKHLIYQIFKNGCMSLFSESAGVNSFYKRFTDPWLSSERQCVKISKKSILVLLGFSVDMKYSYKQIEDSLSKISINDSAEYLKKFKINLGYSEFAKTLIEQLIPRLNDSKNILDFVCSQGCAEYVKPVEMPATSRITLRGSGALDQEKYVADLLKVLSGEKSRMIISEIYRDYEMFDKLPTNIDCPNMEIKDSIIVAENSVHAFDKYIKRNTKMITSGRPDTLSSLVVNIMKSRFLEQLGVRLTGRIELIGDRSHAFSYTSWYKKLNDKSSEYVTKFVNNSARALYSDVVKYGIKSSAPLITNKDHFEVMEAPDAPRRVVITAPSRSVLTNFCKTWVSACATYNFDFDSTRALYDNRLLSHSEFRVGRESFIRCATDVYFKLKINGLGTNHFIQTETSGDKTSYRHTIIIESNNRYIYPDIEANTHFESSKWLTKLVNFIKDSPTMMSSVDYNIPDTNDSIRFVTVDLATAFSIEVLPYSSTIALVNREVILPVCFANVKSIDDLKAGFKATHSDFRDAAILFANTIGEYEGEESISPQVAKALQYIMHKTNSSSKISNVNHTLSKIGTNFNFLSSKQLDIFRSLLLSEGYGNKTVNTSRLNQHVNNLFTSSPDRGSYLAVASLEDKIAYSLDDFIREDDDDELLEDLTYEEVGEALDQQQAEADLFEDTTESESSLPFELVDLDDIDFEAFSDDEAMSDGEQPFAQLDLIEDSDMEDPVSLKSSRTGITVNPNQEFPYATYNFLRKWSNKNPIKRFVGCPKEIESAVDIAKLYLQIYQMSGSVSQNILERLTQSKSIEYPCPLSDLIVIKSTMT